MQTTKHVLVHGTFHDSQRFGNVYVNRKAKGDKQRFNGEHGTRPLVLERRNIEVMAPLDVRLSCFAG